MLHFHTYDFQTVRDNFRLPFKHDAPIYNNVQIECFGVVRDCHRLRGGVHKDMLKDTLQGHSKKIASCRIVHILY